MKTNQLRIPLKTILQKKNIVLAVTCLVATVALSGCVENPPDGENPNSFYYSFEDNMQGWSADGTDLDNPPIDWTVEQTTNMSSEGSGSVKLYLNNMNDAGKIWMEKEFSVQPNTVYSVNVSYQFATSDYGQFNLFKIICGVTNTNPETYEDLMFQGDTGHHNDTVQGEYLWLEKDFSFTVQSDENGSLFVNIGVWGSWETPRTYYVDEVNITITEPTVEHLPDLSGSWTISYYDWMDNLTKTANATIDQTNLIITLQIENETIGQGMLMKNDLLPPFNNTDYIITGLDFGGLGINTIYVHNTSYMITELPLCENCNPAVFTRS